MVYAPGGALLIHWLSLVPLAVLRSIGQLLGKRPGAIGGEFAAAFRVAFDGSVGAGPRADPTHQDARVERDRPAADPGRPGARAVAPPHATAPAGDGEPDLVRAPFFGGGGAAVTLVAAVVGVGVFWRAARRQCDRRRGAASARRRHRRPLVARGVGRAAASGTGSPGPSDPFVAVRRRCSGR